MKVQVSRMSRPHRDTFPSSGWPSSCKAGASEPIRPVCCDGPSTTLARLPSISSRTDVSRSG